MDCVDVNLTVVMSWC